MMPVVISRAGLRNFLLLLLFIDNLSSLDFFRVSSLLRDNRGGCESFSGSKPLNNSTPLSLGRSGVVTYI